MRSLLITSTLALLLVGCSPPAQTSDAPSEPAPQVQACNELTPDISRMVGIGEQMALASAAGGLRGGSIAPGVYDLAGAVRLGEATGWTGERAVALDVREEANGAVTLNWAGAPRAGDVDRWTATLDDSGEHALLSYTCGRMGTVAVEFTAQADALTLRVPDGANGSLQLDFQRRG